MWVCFLPAIHFAGKKKKSKTNQQKNKPKRKEVEMKELRWYAEYEGNAIREICFELFSFPWSPVIRARHQSLSLQALFRGHAKA